MNVACLVVLLIFPTGTFAFAQELNAPLMQQSSGVGLDQWQSGIEEVQGRVEGLVQQRQELAQQLQEEQQLSAGLAGMIEQQRAKNKEIAEFLAKRDGKSDQQLRLEELSRQLASKKKDHDKAAIDYKILHEQYEKAQKSLEALQLKLSGLEFKQEELNAKAKGPRQEDKELVQLRKELEEQKEAEVRMEKQLDQSGKAAIPLEAGRMQEKLKLLHAQKQELLGQTSAKPFPKEAYEMKIRKEELESKVKAYEKRIEALKSAIVDSGEWSSGRKDLVRAIALADARNKRMMDEIKENTENIQLLRIQIGALEKRLSFTKK